MEGDNSYLVESSIFTEAVREHLETHGWARVEGVVAESDVDDAVSGIKQYFAAWDPRLTFDNPAAWTAGNLPSGTVSGINKIGGQTAFMWRLRQHQRVVQMFADYYGVCPLDLRTSFDGFCVYLARAPRRAAQQAPNWAHFDHGTTPKPFKCIQALVVLEDCTGDDDGGLVVWDKSHRAHDGYFAAEGIECKGDWYLLPHEGGVKDKSRPQPWIEQIEKDGRAFLGEFDPERDAAEPVPMPRVRPRARKGDVLVWYSDTAHQNQPPLPTGRDRLAAYVCMAPVAYVTRREFASRRTAFLKARTTSHWPAAGFKANTLRLYTHENARAFEQRRAALEAALPVPELTRLGKTIAGLYDPPHDETSPPDAKRAKATATAKAKDSPLAKMWQRVADYKKKKRAADGDGDGDEEYTPPASGSRKRKPSARGR